jgi:integrase
MMASIAKDPNGRKRILFSIPDRSRKAIRLGKASLHTARTVKHHVEHLANAAAYGCALEPKTAEWVADISDELADKLAAVGLIRQRERATLAAFLDRYISSRTDVKPGTQLAYKQGRNSLVSFFGADRDLRRITPGDADEYRLFLAEKYAEATIGRRIKHAKQFFTAAARRRLIATNPFTEVKGGTQENRERFYFVSLPDSYSVLDACPDAQWRAIFALARFGGLRTPSEVLAQKWVDVDWERERIRISSSKTELHTGKESRLIPMFPELRPYLQAVWDEAEPGTEYVITRYRELNSNLRTGLERIIKRAGLTPWPKLFQNLRSTRETELTERFPMHVVCQWIGNSAAVAAKHYLQVTEEHYQQAVQQEASCP